MRLIELNIRQIIALCKRHKVSQLFVFGSILTNRFNDDSDIDLMVKFDKSKISDYFTNYFDFKYALQDLLGREVDLLEEQAVRNTYLKKNIDLSKELIFSRRIS